jgi:hypothetical protein
VRLFAEGRPVSGALDLDGFRINACPSCGVDELCDEIEEWRRLVRIRAEMDELEMDGTHPIATEMWRLLPEST